MHPILLHWGFITIRSYGAMMALSFILGISLALHLNRKAGRADDPMLDLATVIMVCAVVGARILYVIVQWPSFAHDLLGIFRVWEGGLVYYGGLVGAGLGAYAWLRLKRLPAWGYGDAVAPGLALGQVTGRLGCWFNGCCYGREDAAHGVIFPALGDNIPHLPTMLYESAFCLVLSVSLVWFWRRRRFDGQVFWVYVLAYAVWRFGIEFLRGDPERGVLVSNALSPSQWISLVGAAWAIGMLVHLSRATRRS